MYRCTAQLNQCNTTLLDLCLTLKWGKYKHGVKLIVSSMLTVFQTDFTGTVTQDKPINVSPIMVNMLGSDK